MHVIRLRGPWQTHWSPSLGGDHAVGQEVPDHRPASGESASATAAVYVRSFHRPSGLEPDQQVWLVMQTVRDMGIPDVRLNGQLLEVESDAETQIYRACLSLALNDFNELQLALCVPGKSHSDSVDPPGLDELLAVQIVIAD